eukprot:scaffold14609_cov139-Isochrysis_galbana.AAC.1
MRTFWTEMTTTSEGGTLVQPRCLSRSLSIVGASLRRPGSILFHPPFALLNGGCELGSGGRRGREAFTRCAS